MDENERTELALTTGGFISTLLAIWYPAAALAGNVTAAMSANAQARRFKRLQAAVRRLESRLGADDAKKVKPDLFEEILARATQDEDAEKVNFYAGLIELTAEKDTSASEVRLLANILQNLTVAEMKELRAISKGERANPELKELLKESFWPRMEALALSRGTAKYNGNLTGLGRCIVDIVERAVA